MLQKATSIVLIVGMLAIIGCSASVHTHKIGNGPQTGAEMTERQWYVLWGLVPINDVKTETMTTGATDYEIKTQVTFVDGIISGFTGWLLSPRSVTVTK
jgi:hypothetical protein